MLEDTDYSYDVSGKNFFLLTLLINYTREMN